MSTARPTARSKRPYGWTVTLETDENGDLIMPILDDLMTECDWEIGDLIDFDTVPSNPTILIQLENVSKTEIPLSQFRRQFTGLLRKIISPTHPLRRVVVTRAYRKVAILKQYESITGDNAVDSDCDTRG